MARWKVPWLLFRGPKDCRLFVVMRILTSGYSRRSDAPADVVVRIRASVVQISVENTGVSGVVVVAAPIQAALERVISQGPLKSGRADRAGF